MRHLGFVMLLVAAMTDVEFGPPNLIDGMLLGWDGALFTFGTWCDVHLKRSRWP